MSKTDGDQLGPLFAARLRAELDRARPLYSEPRYGAAHPRIGVWRLAPAALAVAFTGILGLTAWAATGSANPAVWTQRVETVINPPSPSPTPETKATPAQSQAVPPAAPTHKATQQPTQKPVPSHSPDPHESPEPDEHHSGGGSHGGGGFNWPSPTPSPWHSPSPSPPQDH